MVKKYPLKQPHPNNGIAALVNVILPPFGYLVQGRVAAFLIYFFILAINIALCFVGIGVVTLFIQYCYGIYNAATYQEYKLT